MDPSGVVKRWTAQEKESTREREKGELRGSALKGEKPGRKVPPNAAESQISA